MDQGTRAALSTFVAMADALHRMPSILAKAYADGQNSTEPIVDQHFTPGNASRQGWPPLSRAYALAKARGLTKNRRGEVSDLQKVGARNKKVRIDRNAEFHSKTGTVSGIGTMSNLPMLVRTGLLRTQVVSKSLHKIAQRGDTAFLTFDGLPDYAGYLQTGTGRMPQRSPVNPSFEDVLLIEDVMRRTLDGITKGGTKGLAVTVAMPANARAV